MTANLLSAQPDKQGCKDLPYLSRFPGSQLGDCSHSNDDTFKFTVTVSGKDQQKTVEGKLDKLYYNYPQTASRPQLIRNFNTALSTAGYKKVYDSGVSGDMTWNKGGLWIFISISGAPHYEVYTVQEVALTQDVVATAAELGNGIGGTGHAVVYPPNFLRHGQGRFETRVEQGTGRGGQAAQRPPGLEDLRGGAHGQRRAAGGEYRSLKTTGRSCGAGAGNAISRSRPAPGRLWRRSVRSGRLE